MKSGGKFSHVKAIRESLIETLTDLEKEGIVEAYKGAGIVDEGNKAAFYASAIEKSFIKEPLKGMAGGMVHFFGNVSKQTNEKLEETKATTHPLLRPLNRIGYFAYYLAKDTIVGTGENLGEGLAKAYTARTSDQLVEGLSQFYGGVAGGAGLIGGGAAGVGAKATVSSLTATGSGAGSLTLQATAVGIPAATGAVGAVASGSLVASVTSESGVQGSGGGGRGSPPKAVDGPELNWHGQKTRVRVKSNEELVEWANQNAGFLEQPSHTLRGSRSVGELQVRELRRRSREGVDHVGQKIDEAARRKLDEVADRLDRAIKEARPELDHFQFSPGDARMSSTERLAESTRQELMDAGSRELQPFSNRAKDIPYKKDLVQELRARKLAFEGEDGTAMLRLADELDDAIKYVEGASAVRNALVMDIDMGEVIGRLGYEGLHSEANAVLKGEWRTSHYLKSLTEALRKYAESERWFARKRIMKSLANQVERKIPEVQARERAFAAESEAALRASEAPPPVEHRTLSDLFPNELRNALDYLRRPRSPGSVDAMVLPHGLDPLEVTPQAIENELVRRGLKP